MFGRSRRTKRDSAVADMVDVTTAFMLSQRLHARECVHLLAGIGNETSLERFCDLVDDHGPGRASAKQVLDNTQAARISVVMTSEISHPSSFLPTDSSSSTNPRSNKCPDRLTVENFETQRRSNI